MFLSKGFWGKMKKKSGTSMNMKKETTDCIGGGAYSRALKSEPVGDRCLSTGRRVGAFSNKGDFEVSVQV